MNMKQFQSKESVFGFLSVFIGVLTIVAVIIAIGQIKILDTDKYEGFNTISVSGTGEAIGTPDVARVYFTVEDTQVKLADAQANVTKKMDGVTEQLVSLGIAKEKIKTSYYSSYPKYEYSQGKSVICSPEYCPPVPTPGTQTLVGYTVSHSVEVTIKDIEKSGDVLSLLGKAGVTNISGPNFEIEDPDALKSDAREAAIADAREKAKQIAKDLHVGLGKIVGYSDDSSGYMPVPMYERSALSAKDGYGGGVDAVAAPSLTPGESKVSSNVTITFKIK